MSPYREAPLAVVRAAPSLRHQWMTLRRRVVVWWARRWVLPYARLRCWACGQDLGSHRELRGGPTVYERGWVLGKDSHQQENGDTA